MIDDEGHAMTMGQHTTLNGGHRGEDGSAVAAPVVKPLVIRRPHGPVSGWPQATPKPDLKPGNWERVKSWLRVIFAHRGWLAAVPVVLVNAVAFGAQLGYWKAHLPVLAQAVLVALALESIAIYLAYQAHLAQLADDSSLRLRLSAYGMALVIGALNYSHFDGPGWRPTVPAVTFGLMSVISPWLWSAHSRRVSRDALKQRGLIEPHAVRLGGTRWAWHPVRSVRVMSRATWTGETDPAAAIATWQPRTDTAPAQASPEVTPETRIQVSPEQVPSQAPSQPAQPVQVRPRGKAQVKPARISDDDLKQEIRATLKAGTAPSVNAVAKALGRGRDRVRPLLEEVRGD